MSENIHGLLAAYTVDAVTDAERDAFEGHLDGCDDCRIELAELREVTAAMAAAEDAAPPAALRARVLDEIARTPQLPPRIIGEAPSAPTPAEKDDAADELGPRRAGRRRSPWWVLSSAAASVAVVASVVVGGLILTREDPSAGLEQDAMMVMSAPDALAVDLGDDAHVVLSEKMQALVAMGEDCPQPKAGMEYQLWVMLEDGSTVPGPTFMPEHDGSFMAKMETDVATIAGFALTQEPRGGSEQPTTGKLATVDL